MHGIDNFRELGGLPTGGGRVRPGVLFRSGHLASATDDDHATLMALGVRTVVDLRNDLDIEAEGPDRLPHGIDYVRAPIGSDPAQGSEIRRLIMRGDLAELRIRFGDGRGQQMAIEGAVGMVADGPDAATFGPALAVIADPARWPVLWHCSAGKDRAGWVATAVLLSLGTPTSAIVDHYLESNHRRRTRAVDGNHELSELLAPFLFVDAAYVHAQLEAVDERCTSSTSVLEELYDLSPAAVAAFRTALVEADGTD